MKTTNTMDGRIHAAVARGAALLDREYPDWYLRLDRRTLRLQSCVSCVLGQLFGTPMRDGYGVGLDYLARVTAQPLSAIIERYGFLLSDDRGCMHCHYHLPSHPAHPETIDAAWGALRACWLEAVDARLQTHPLPTVEKHAPALV